MLTNIKTYEGVPIGRHNFDDFMYYIRSFLGANFSFSVNATSDGGYFSDSGFHWANYYPGGPGYGIWRFIPISSSETGSVFGRDDTNEFYRFDYRSDRLACRVWEVLATSGVEGGGYKLRFSTNDLPYGPNRFYNRNVVGQGFAPGFNYISYNGIPQLDNFTYSLTRSYSSPATSTLSANKLHMGAEAIVPMATTADVYTNVGTVNTSSPSSTAGITTTYISDRDGRVRFPFTNFSLDYGGHILLRRDVGSNRYFSYMPQDLSDSSTVPSGYYKVRDYAKGEIEPNLSMAQLNELLDPSDTFSNDTDKYNNMRFQILSAEQLEEETVGGVTSYYSRYKYDGNTSNVILVSYEFDGQNNLVTEVPSDNYVAAEGNLLLQDASQQYVDSVILAITYDVNIDLDDITSVQSNKYQPDVLQLYYSEGVSTSAVPSSDDVRAFVQHNECSWYNRDILNSQYAPVSRAVETYLSFASSGEGVSNSFDPNHQFQITDTINLKDLGDVYGKGGTTLFKVASSSATDKTVLQFDYSSSKFIATDFTLAELEDVALSSPSNNQVLTYNSASSRWEAQSLGGSLGYTPLARSGGSDPSDYTMATNKRIFYTTAMPYGSYSNSTLTSVQFVNGAVADHANKTSSVHGSTTSATANTIAQRDGSARLTSSPPPANDTTSNLLATAGWVMGSAASTSAVANKLMLRGSNGRADSVPIQNAGINDVVTAASGSYVNTVVTSQDIYRWSGDSNPQNVTGDRLVRRDADGRAYADLPLYGGSAGNNSLVNMTYMAHQTTFSGSTGYISFEGVRLVSYMSDVTDASWNAGQSRDYTVYFAAYLSLPGPSDSHPGYFLPTQPAAWTSIYGGLSENFSVNVTAVDAFNQTFTLRVKNNSSSTLTANTLTMTLMVLLPRSGT